MKSQESYALEECEKSLGLAQRYREAGQIDQSSEVLESLLDKYPGHPEALFWLSHQKTLTPDSKALSQLESWYREKRVNSVSNSSYLLFALGRVREKQERWDEAYQFYLNANQQHKQELNLLNTDANIYIGQSRLHKSLYKSLRRLPSFVFGSDFGKDLVFIVGLPRCGSTLVETIIGMSSEACPLGELKALPLALEDSEIINLLKEERLEPSLLKNRLSKLDIVYRNNIPTNLGIKLDKTLTNFYLLGLISRVWPAAKIIHVKRHPLDQIMSAWKSRFAIGHRYSLELSDLIKVYASYNDLMDFWQTEFGSRIYICKYERLVKKPINESKSLASFCGIQWSEKMLKPQYSDRKVKTASFQTIREPINVNSVGSWKNYAKQLEPYLKELISLGVDVED